MANSGRRLPVYLLIDCSGSMCGDRIDSVKAGIKVLLQELKGDPQALETAWLSVICFASYVKQVSPLTELLSFKEPQLEAGGSTRLGGALSLLLNCIDKEVKKSTQNQKGDWRPLVFILTDGIATDKPELEQAIERIRAFNTMNIVACMIGDGEDPSFLKQITNNVIVMKSDTPASFASFFAWVSNSIRLTSQNMNAKPRQVINQSQLPQNIQAVSPNVSEEKSYEGLAALAPSVVMIGVHDSQNTLVATGSGISINKDGYILTNCHVIEKGQAFSVRLENSKDVYTTTAVIKYNPQLDLAIIRINHQLEPLPIYRGAKELVRGQKCLAIGSPLGLFNSVSDGIISGFRDIDGQEMIQFTAPTSHGSSGGALINTSGEVIGICTAGVEDGQNINFAVSYKHILQFASSFIK